jgi:hypothetical protein
MKKVFAVLMLGVLLFGTASAQEFWGQGKMSYGAGAELSLPMGNLGDVAGMGFGGFGKFQYGLNQDMTIVGSVGYTMWGEKDNGGVKSSANALIILGGVKYSLATVTKGFYAIGEAGIYSMTVKMPAINLGFFTIPAAEASSSEFVIAPGVGMEFGNIDVSAKYVINGDAGNLAVRVAYQMPL